MSGLDQYPETNEERERLWEETKQLMEEFKAANHLRRAEIAMQLSEVPQRFAWRRDAVTYRGTFWVINIYTEAERWREHAMFESRLALAEAIGRAGAFTPEALEGLRRLEARDRDL